MTTSEQIIECEKQLSEAMLQSDVKTLNHLIHDDLVFVNHQGMLFTKEMDLEAYRSAALKLENIRLLDLQVVDYNDCAVANVSVELRGAYLEHAFNDKVRFVRTWKKINNSWKIIAGNSSLIHS
jgi:ketosteroid isomerase-like protein